jgi:hypothetical protein
MSEQIEAGDGWRLIDKQKDTKRPGDEYWSCLDEWVTSSNDGIFYSEHVYRRRIPAKPERLVLKEVTASICHRKKKPETWEVVASIDAAFPGTGYLDGDEARQLADWLTRFADWREAQDAAK